MNEQTIQELNEIDELRTRLFDILPHAHPDFADKVAEWAWKLIKDAVGKERTRQGDNAQIAHFLLQEASERMSWLLTHSQPPSSRDYNDQILLTIYRQEWQARYDLFRITDDKIRHFLSAKEEK